MYGAMPRTWLRMGYAGFMVSNQFICGLLSGVGRGQMRFHVTEKKGLLVQDCRHTTLDMSRFKGCFDDSPATNRLIFQATPTRQK